MAHFQFLVLYLLCHLQKLDIVSQQMKEMADTLEIIKKHPEESALRKNKSDLLRIKSEQPLHSHANLHHENLLIDISAKKAQGLSTENQIIKKALIIYASGSIGANSSLQVPRGNLKKQLQKNFYFCDYKQSIKNDPTLQTLISPKFDNGVRVAYRFVELKKIEPSICLEHSLLVEIASHIQQNYETVDAFIVISGMDTICYLASTLSFMLENLNKLVICSGGYLPLSTMRNDSIMSLNQSFAAVSETSAINDVLIINKNKGYRGNRCLKSSQGDFQCISSPNLKAIISIKTNLRIRSYLLEPKPLSPFQVFYKMSNQVKIMKLNFLQPIKSIQYELKNPYIKGIVIESYSFSNMPHNEQLLNLFKQAHEENGTIFVNISQSIKSHNSSLMADYLKSYHIHFGLDMTPQAALAKLSYLLGKNLPKQTIIELISKNMRGELTQKKDTTQFQLNEAPFMNIVTEIIHQQYPTTIQEYMNKKLEKGILEYIATDCTVKQFWKIFGKLNLECFQDELGYKVCSDFQGPDGSKKQFKISRFIKTHELLHLLAKKGNLPMLIQILEMSNDINTLDSSSCSPLFYALKNEDKKMIHELKKHGGKVIVPAQNLFQLFVIHLKKDNLQFFELLAHMEFKNTLAKICNKQKRNVLHLAALLGAKKCYRFIQQKFKVPNYKGDLYHKTPTQYLQSRNITSQQ